MQRDAEVEGQEWLQVVVELAAAGGALRGAPGRRDAGDRDGISGSSEPEETGH